MTCELFLHGPSLCCALGTTPDAILRRALAADTSGMTPLPPGTLPNDATSPFGYVPPPLPPAPTRCEALLELAARPLDPLIAAARDRYGPARIAIVLGSSNANMEEHTLDGVPLDMSLPARSLAASRHLAGPALVVSTACSSGLKAFATARRLLLSGLCDAALVGGVDAYATIVTNGFHALEALSPAPTLPMSRHRAGINLGEGAALFLATLAPPDAPLSPALPPPLRLLGLGESSDAHHSTAPDPSGAGALASMRAALRDAGLPPSAIACIHLHGTGTPLNDAMESRAIYDLFGPSAPDAPPSLPLCSSTKPLTGHCLGAAGAIELALCALTLQAALRAPDHRFPLLPHVWDADPDPDLPPLPLVPLGATLPAPAPILLNAFAFGGSNASAILAP